jgi:chromosome segregation ATPase
LSDEPSATALNGGAAPELAADSQTQEELDRVREIILGPDPMKQRMRRAESDRLRDILFGAQIEEYDRRFADMRRELELQSNHMREITERLGDLEKSIARRFETIELDVRTLSDDARREADRNRNRESLQQQLTSQVRQHEETIVSIGEGLLDLRKSHAMHEADIRGNKAGLIDTRDQLEQRTQVLRREIRSTEDSVRAELRRIADRLENQKTDRRALASMLIELATRLETGSNVTGLLEGLKSSKE